MTPAASCHTCLVKRLVAGLLGVLVVVAGCAHVMPGAPVAGPRDPDPAAFFAGEPPMYGQVLDDERVAVQSYLRALRRTDPCGFTTPSALARIGEIGSTGTTFDFNHCELDVKVPGDADPKIVSVIVGMAPIGDEDPVFTVGDLPVYPYDDVYCGLQMPLPLAEQPGAPPLNTPDQPVLQLAEQIAEQGCEFIEELAKAVAVNVIAFDPARLPARDALAVFPVRAAERDPCAVLGGLDGVAAWDADMTQPYACAFTLSRDGVDVDVQLLMKPRSPKSSEGGYFKEERDGAEVYVGHEYCSAIAYLGDPMQRRTTAGEAIDMGEWATAPAVTVNVDAPHCDVAAEVAVAASKVFR